MGIAQKDKEVAATLVRSGRFIETYFKLMSEIQQNFSDQQVVAILLDKLLICQKAHIRYTQEHQTLPVHGQFGLHTKSVFRSLQKIASSYTPETIENLKTAVTLTAGTNNSQQQSQFASMRGGFKQQGPRPWQQKGKFRFGNNNVVPVYSYHR